METLEALAARLDTTNDIRSIVRTMKSLSSVNIRNYERAVEAISEYERTIRQGLQIVLRNDRERKPRQQARDGKSGLIVIGSDRGLCGRFNDRIADFASERLRNLGTGTDHAPLLAVVGVRAAARLEALDHPADLTFTLPGSLNGLAGTVQSVAVAVDRWVNEAGVRRVTLLFNRRGPGTLAEPAERVLLPIPADFLDDLARQPWPSSCLPTYRMEREKLFSWLIGQHLFTLIYRGLAESLASEHASRLAAMQGAERNIDERREDLQSAYRQKRQETVTMELLDLIAGFEALQQKT